MRINTKAVLAFSLMATGVSITTPVSAFAQGLGQIVGTVTDPSDAVVSGATITVTQVGTGFARTAKSNAQGEYAVPSLHPANYQVAVRAAGFSKFSSVVTLQADQSLTVNVGLKMGEASQTVTVQGAAALVDTTSSSLGQVVDQARVVNLPLNGRNAASLTTLVAGVTPSSIPNGGADQGQTKTFPAAVITSTNGSRQNMNTFMLDGGDNNDDYTNVNAPFPFPDALQEFSMETSDYSAQYGQNAGAVVNAITKEGTNQLHGDAFEFVRNRVFNAANYFAYNAKTGQKTVDALKRNQYGATIGGPVVIPGIYNGHNHTFFFFGYQGTRLRNVQNGLQSFVPTQANVNGDFSAYLSASNPANPIKKAAKVIDPATGLQCDYNGQPNMCNPAEFDPASVTLATKYLPAVTGDGTVQYSKPLKQDFSEWIYRIDQSMGSKDQLTFREYYNQFTNAGEFNPANILIYADGSSILYQNLMIHEAHTFSTNLLNDFRVSYGRDASTRGPISGVPNVEDFGVSIPYQPAKKAIQGINVSGFFSFGDNPNAKFIRNNYTYSDDISWVKARHNIHFGGVLLHTRLDDDNGFLSPGSFTFNTFAGDSGLAISDFLFGQLQNLRQGYGEYNQNRGWFPGIYFEDHFRATRRLTLNYGLRYEPFIPKHEIRHRVMQWSIAAFEANRTSQVYTNAPPGLLFPGDSGVPEDGYSGSYGDVAPRLGFAYDVSGNGTTSIRGGFGMFYSTEQSGSYNNRFVDASPFSPQVNDTPSPGPFSDPYCLKTSTQTGYGCKAGVSPFPAPFPPPKNTPFVLPDLVVTYDSADGGKFRVPLSYDWNLTVEHQLGQSWMVRAAYVASHSSHLAEFLDLNPSLYSLYQSNNCAANPKNPACSTDARRMFNQGPAGKAFSNIVLDDQDINSNYNSFQGTVEKHLGHGIPVTILANYTWSKNLDDMPEAGGAAGPSEGQSSALPWYLPNRHRNDYGPSIFNVPQNFVTSYVWDLPELSNFNSALRTTLGSWQITGILSAHSGYPVTVDSAGDQSLTGLGNDRSVIVGAPYGGNACGSKAPCVNFLNPASFQQPTLGSFGNIGKDTLIGPKMVNWDMGFFKVIPVRESLRAEFRAEFFNIFNHANFTPANLPRVGNGGFGQITSAADPRIGQLALKIDF